MNKDCIYIRLCSNNNIVLSNLKVILKDICNKIVYEGITDRFGNIELPICDNEVYKIIIYSNFSIILVPIIAKKNRTYCINITNNNIKKHLITILLTDKNYPNLRIKGGKIILCQDIQFL